MTKIRSHHVPTSLLLLLVSACSDGAGSPNESNGSGGQDGLASGGQNGSAMGSGGFATTGGTSASGGIFGSGGDLLGTGGDGAGGSGTGSMPATGGDTNTGGSGGDPVACPAITYPMPPERTRLIQGQYTADPSAHVFDCKLYFYPSHDQDNANGFNMVDYHVFSLGTDGAFKDEGRILHLDDVPWAKQYAWAPDAAYKNGKYYFYFPAKDDGGIFRVGVAVADTPIGPFTPEATPITGSYSIDQSVFVDDDGKAYMYFGGQWGGQLECYNSGSYKAGDCSDDNGNGGSGDGKPRVVSMGDDMKSFTGSVQEVSLTGSPARFFEGAWVHKYNEKYYFSYSDGPSHRLHYAMSDSPTGPFAYQGVLLPDHGAGWTTHHSVVEFQGSWYLFYHDSSCSGNNTNKRCVKYASLTYKADGTINTINP